MKTDSKKTLIAYFSHAGENYVNGAMKHLEIGNCKVAAQMIQEITGGDLFYINTVFKYPGNHLEKINRAKEELTKQVRPELTEQVQHMENYEVVFLVYPNWWGTCPMAVFTFLESYDFTGKKIAPICTHEGSGLSTSVSDITKICGADVLKPLAIQGAKIQGAAATIENWIQEL